MSAPFLPTRTRWVVTLRAALRRVSAIVRTGLAESLTALAFIAGWLLITDGIAHLRWVSPAIAWRLSIGLLAVSLGGWRLLVQMVWHGLYLLDREDRR